VNIDIETAGADAALARVGRALDAIAAGRPVIVVDDEHRENEGDLVFAAECATPELMAFTVRHTSGYVCVALPASECDRLDLPPMHSMNTDRMGTAYRVTVDLATGVGTGISARDRARTVAAHADRASDGSDFTRPGHVVPLLARAGGVLSRPGHTEAAVDLTRLAGMRPAGALCEIVSQDLPGEMARGPELQRFATEHGLVLISIADLIAYRRRHEPQLARVAVTALPTAHGGFRAIGYRGLLDGAEHIALLTGTVGKGERLPVYVHAECLTGDVLGSLSCGCRRRLENALSTIAAAGRGLVVYTRSVSRARGCGLFECRRGPTEQEPAEVAAQVLRDLGIRSVQLLDGAPGELAILHSYGYTPPNTRPHRESPPPEPFHSAMAQGAVWGGG
jgi:3,4-dihydroxy 2-butanone 4-phosphate synthase/GTP cyclohydrolase II